MQKAKCKMQKAKGKMQNAKGKRQKAKDTGIGINNQINRCAGLH